MALPDCTMAVLHPSSLYFTSPWIYFTLLESTLFYYDSISVYYTPLHSTNDSTSLRLTLATSFCHGSTSLSFNLPHFTTALAHSNWLYFYYGSTSLYHCSIYFYFTLPWLYFILLDSTTLYYGSTWLYTLALLFSLNVLPFIKPLLDFTLAWLYWLYHGSTSYTIALLLCTWLHSTL